MDDRNRLAELEAKMDANPHCEHCAPYEYNLEALTDEEAEEYYELSEGA